MDWPWAALRQEESVLLIPLFGPFHFIAMLVLGK
jgi:hypothetical protein